MRFHGLTPRKRVSGADDQKSLQYSTLRPEGKPTTRPGNRVAGGLDAPRRREVPGRFAGRNKPAQIRSSVEGGTSELASAGPPDPVIGGPCLQARWSHPYNREVISDQILSVLLARYSAKRDSSGRPAIPCSRNWNSHVPKPAESPSRFVSFSSHFVSLSSHFVPRICRFRLILFRFRCILFAVVPVMSSRPRWLRSAEFVSVRGPERVSRLESGLEGGELVVIPFGKSSSASIFGFGPGPAALLARRIAGDEPQIASTAPRAWARKATSPLTILDARTDIPLGRKIFRFFGRISTTAISKVVIGGTASPTPACAKVAETSHPRRTDQVLDLFRKSPR